MIPKKIHYIWLGEKPKSNMTHICINSWRKYLPEYEIIEWNEKNLNLDEIAKKNPFFNECRKRKLWAYMADYLRLYILYEYGGIYFDTDIQVIRSLDDLLDNTSFIGKEVGGCIGTGVIATEPKNNVIKRILNYYNKEIWESDLYTIPMIVSSILDNDELLSKEIKIYEMDYFSPYDYNKEFNQEMLTENTYTIHWFSGNWINNINVGTFLQTKHIKNKFKKYIIITKKVLSYYYKKIIK